MLVDVIFRLLGILTLLALFLFLRDRAAAIDRAPEAKMLMRNTAENASVTYRGDIGEIEM